MTAKAQYIKDKAEYEAKYGKIRRKSKKFIHEETDPNKPAPPKRPLSAFFRYVKSVEESVKSANPDKKRI